MFDAPLQLIVLIGWISILLEVLGTFVRSMIVKRVCYLAVIILVIFATVVLLGYDLRLVTWLVALVTVFRVFNAVRVVWARTEKTRLHHASRRSSHHLILLQVCLFLLWLTVLEYELRPVVVLYSLVGVSFMAGVVILLSARRNLQRTKQRSADAYVADMELPSVSICIPARNETSDLPACLASALEIDYPKLEILVLDDCSQDKTSEIIKGFARDGVRFIVGEPPVDGWLAKNQAYQALSEAASGEILLFCGVDVRFDKNTLRALVGSMFARKKQMVSLLPYGLQVHQHAMLAQSMRYWWELALPRRTFNRPPVLSTAWAITRQAFFGLGGMKAVKNSVLPEGYFARELARSEEYSFMRAGRELVIHSAKKLPGQWQSAIRTRYPRLRKRPENVLYVLGLELWFLILPVCLFLLGFFVDLGLLWLIAGLNACILFYVHWLIFRAWNPDHSSLAVALFPIAVVTEIAVLLISMWCYEFFTVTWKDRNICIPVMQVIPRLPSI